MKRIQFWINNYTFLFSLMMITFFLSFIIPDFRYNYINPSTQNIISSEQIKNYQISEPLTIVPNSYHKIESVKTPHFKDIFVYLITGIENGIQIIIFILVTGVFVEFLKKTGAIYATFNFILKASRYNINLIVIFTVLFFSSISSFFGLKDENIFFYPFIMYLINHLNIPPFIGIVTVITGISIGILSSVMNPMSVGVALPIIHINILTGIHLRIILFILSNIVASIYLIHFIRKKRYPIHKMDVISEDLTPEFQQHQFKELLLFKHILTMITALLTIIMAGYTLSHPATKIHSVTAIFLMSILFVGLINRMSERKFIQCMHQGIALFTPIALVVGITRGLTTFMQDTGLTDQIFYLLEHTSNTSSPYLFILYIFIATFLLSFLFTSVSSISAFMITLIYPLSVIHHVSISIITLTFVSAVGIAGMLNPIGAILANVLYKSNINYTEWVKFIYPLIIGLTILSIGFIFISEALQ